MLARTLALVLVAGCSNGQHLTLPDMARAPTDHPPLWQVAKGSGPVQAAPEVWTIAWQGDEVIGAATADFVDWMLHSDYWTRSLAEYGVGAGVSKGLIVLPMAPPAVLGDAELQQLATTLVGSGQVTANANTSIAFIPPRTTTVRAGGSESCSVFLGYHSYTGGSQAVAYSITARCGSTPGDPLDQITDTLSHEVAETATDPQPRSGYIDDSPGEQEIADLCEFGLDTPVDVPADATHAARRYWVQRLYSSMRAQDGTIDPCLPMAWDHPYWNVALDPAVVGGKAGSSASIDARLDVFAYGDVGTIRWIASSSGADVEPAVGEAHAGDTIPIAITPLSTLNTGDVIEIDILAEAAKGGSQLWIGYVEGRAQ